MTPTIEGNKLIAEFMGGKVEQFVWRKYEPMGVSFAEQVHGLQAHLLHDLEYHTSWDWLMPVVEKIEKIDEFPFADLSTDINSVWKAVIEFIQHYNQQNT